MKGEVSMVKLDATAARRLARLGRRGQVLEEMWAGKCTKEIAADLGLSPKTVEFHRENLYRLFGVHDPVSLCRRGLEMELIHVEDEW
jgi:DNA-binding NarL/FixJ family response regulator